MLGILRAAPLFGAARAAFLRAGAAHTGLREDPMQAHVRTSDTLRHLTYAALRVTCGVILAAHGWLKLMDVAAWQQQLASLGIATPKVLAYCAIAGEFLGGVGLIVGLLTPLAALGPACVTAAAIVLVHWGNGLFMANNGFEFPLALLVASLFFMAHGGGAWSLDAVVFRKRRASREGASAGTSRWEERPHMGG
jgi:putative oxidoreductase